jgi:hypothetical protein
MNEPPDQTAVFSAENFIVTGGDHSAEVLLEDLWVFTQARVGVQEDDALRLEIFADLVIDDL